MKFKTIEKLQNEYWKLTPKARYLASYIDYLLWKWWGKEATITCIYYSGGSGVHSQWRAFDIRTENELSGKQIAQVEEHINSTFPYDVNRPNIKTILWHKVGEDKIKNYKLVDFKPQYHLHAQVWVK